jgi:hypothetical protein
VQHLTLARRVGGTSIDSSRHHLCTTCSVRHAFGLLQIDTSPSPFAPRGIAATVALPMPSTSSLDEPGVVDLEERYQDNHNHLISRATSATAEHSAHKSTRPRTPSSVERGNHERTPPRSRSSKLSGASPTYKRNPSESRCWLTLVLIRYCCFIFAPGSGSLFSYLRQSALSRGDLFVVCVSASLVRCLHHTVSTSR